MKIFIVVAIYKEEIQNSITVKSIVENNILIGSLFNQVELLIYDNSPAPQKLEINLSFPIIYYSDINNGGLSPAYNYAYKLAKSHYDWILFLDQDTELNKEYFIELKNAMEKININNDAVSIIPKMFHDKTNFSPAQVKWGGIHRPINMKYSGVYKNGELMAIGSGMVLKTTFISSIGGFNKLFWLDCLDRWVFLSIYRLGKKCYILPIKLNHQLSILDFSKYMNPKKYLNQIYYEALFMLMYKSLAENIFYLIRIFRRSFYLFYQTKNFGYSKYSLLLILAIIKSKFNSNKLNNFI
jgi:GT2 family glycosyltransferase